MDVLTLSRVQFALTIMFHYLFPPLTIGLAAVIAVLLWKYLRTKDPVYHAAAHFWTALFAANFAIGVATGVVMEFQFGTNWSRYSVFVGDIFGSALAAEGIFAFFLESGFLAVLVFGWDRVSPRMHFVSAVLVALGSVFSAIWIIVANSWQQTPAGFRLVGEGAARRAEITGFWDAVLNPSTVGRLLHTLNGAYVLGAFFVLSISAFYLLRGRHEEFARRSFSVALSFGAIFSALLLVTGDQSARIVAEHQPPKLAAMEGHFEDGPADLHVFGVPRAEEGRVALGVAIPRGLSLLVHRDPNASIPGLASVPLDARPPVAVPFYAFHVMVALGTAFIALTFLGLWLRRKGTLFRTRWLLWIFVFAVLGTYASNQLGWVVAEVGRQPWTVWNLLRTEHSFSPSVTSGQVLQSVVLFGLVYAGLFLVWVYVMNAKIQAGPPPAVPPPGHAGGKELVDVAATYEEPGRSHLAGEGRR